MLRLKVVTAEDYDEKANLYIEKSAITLELEHSLVSLSKWESKWEIPFLSSEDKTDEQVADYIRMMLVSGDFPEEVWEHLRKPHYDQINDYINAKMTATTVREHNKQPQQEIVTAELIYYWMIALGIPFECEHWHLARLLMLIKVCNIKNGKPEKKSARDVAAERTALNAARKAKLGTKG